MGSTARILPNVVPWNFALESALDVAYHFVLASGLGFAFNLSSDSAWASALYFAADVAGDVGTDWP
jgi:hypothetical protein